MSLSAGTRLGAYEIIAAIGAGGMGEVYRARDTTLNRDVALKILPDAFARRSRSSGAVHAQGADACCAEPPQYRAHLRTRRGCCGACAGDRAGGRRGLGAAASTGSDPLGRGAANMEPAAGSSPSMSTSPTLTTPAMTQAGMISRYRGLHEPRAGEGPRSGQAQRHVGLRL